MTWCEAKLGWGDKKGVWVIAYGKKTRSIKTLLLVSETGSDLGGCLMNSSCTPVILWLEKYPLSQVGLLGMSLGVLMA